LWLQSFAHYWFSTCLAIQINIERRFLAMQISAGRSCHKITYFEDYSICCVDFYYWLVCGVFYCPDCVVARCASCWPVDFFYPRVLRRFLCWSSSVLSRGLSLLLMLDGAGFRRLVVVSPASVVQLRPSCACIRPVKLYIEG